MVKGWKMIARAAYWRCCAMLSAISFRAAILESEVVRRVVVRGGIPSRGLDVGEDGDDVGCEGAGRSEESSEDMVASEEVVRRGGRV